VCREATRKSTGAAECCAAAGHASSTDHVAAPWMGPTERRGLVAACPSRVTSGQAPPRRRSAGRIQTSSSPKTASSFLSDCASSFSSGGSESGVSRQITPGVHAGRAELDRIARAQRPPSWRQGVVEMWVKDGPTLSFRLTPETGAVGLARAAADRLVPDRPSSGQP
jgi:hypothetical protein